MPDIVLDRVSLTYPGGIRAVVDLSLTLPAGSLTVLAGPSGCGKTSTLRLLAGLERPTAGEVYFGSVAGVKLPPWRRNVSLLAQRPALFPHLTVAQNLTFPHRPCPGRGWRAWPWRPAPAAVAKQRQLADVAGRLRIADLLGRYPADLSGGQQQRVALGRAWLAGSDVVLLDEPLTHLDPPLRDGLRDELLGMHRATGCTLVSVTHDPAEALGLGGRLAVLSGGELQQSGPAADLLARPSTRAVAEFFAWPPCNWLDGELRREGNLFFFVADGVKLPLPEGKPRDKMREVRGVTAAVRPHTLWLGAVDAEPHAEGLTWVSGVVTAVEAYPGLRLIRVATDNLRLTVQLDPAGRDVGGVVWEPGPGQPLRVGLDPRRTDLFDRHTGKSLAGP